MPKYCVELWEDGDDYEADKPADWWTEIEVDTEEEAIEKAEEHFGCRCDVSYVEEFE